MKVKNKSYSIIISILFIIMLYSCAPRISKHGYILSNEEIKLMKNTRLNKSEILEIFGQPSSKATFSDNVWYYISQTRNEKAYFEVENASTNVIVIVFDKNQDVKNYRIYTEEDSIEVKISSDKTKTVHEKDESLIKDFFSSFMRRLAEPKLPANQ